jgi:ribokinase
VGHPRVIVVGSVNVDLVMRVPRLPRPGETVTGGVFATRPGGKGGNAASAAARLGAATWLVGFTGQDDLGSEAREALVDAGVDLEHLHGTDEAATGVAHVLVDDAGENAIAVAPGANAVLRPRHVEDAVRALARRGAVVLANLEAPLAAVEAAAATARAAGARFVLDPAPARDLPQELIAACDVLTPNEGEAAALGHGPPDELLALGAGAVVVTEGPRGCTLYRAGEPPHEQPAFAVDVVDTTGAGDAFAGALAWALAGGDPLEEAVRLASAAGALATRGLGARGSQPGARELRRLARDLELS